MGAGTAWSVTKRCNADDLQGGDSGEARREKEAEWGEQACVPDGERSAADTLEEPDEPEVADSANEEDERQEDRRPLRQRRGHREGKRAGANEREHGGGSEAKSDEERGKARRGEGRTPVDLRNGCAPTPPAAKGPVDVQAREEGENECECEGRHFNRDLGTGA